MLVVIQLVDYLNLPLGNKEDVTTATIFLEHKTFFILVMTEYVYFNSTIIFVVQKIKEHKLRSQHLGCS